jgi:hypothetical protein
MAINIVKFLNGDEIMGETKVVEDSLMVTNAAQIIVVPGPNGQHRMALAPFMPYAKTKKFDFQLSMVMTFAEPVDELLNQYNQIFGAGIVIAKTM